MAPQAPIKPIHHPAYPSHTIDLTANTDPSPLTEGNEIYEKGLKYIRPALTFDSTQWQPLAEALLPANSIGYVSGNAGTGQTHANNRAAFQKWGLVPRRLTNAQTFPDLSVELFGKKYPYPIAVAPVGVQKIFHPDGEVATAKAAAAEGVPYIMSSASATSTEAVAEANGDGQRWYQLYWPSVQHNEFTASMLKRAQASGYDVLMVNVDTFIVGWRPTDLDHGYSPFLRADHVGVEIGLTDPVYRKMFKEKYGKEVEEDLATAAATWLKIFVPGYPHGWEDFAFLKEHWKGPIVVKGIQTVEDAKKCVEIGMDGIVVSNHGGRQVDGGVASLDFLPEIVDAVGDDLVVMFDSGIRSGVDIIKALAMGAKMCLIGRPWVYGLALQGEAGVSHVLKALLGEVDISLHLTGIKSIQKDLIGNRSWLRKVA